MDKQFDQLVSYVLDFVKNQILNKTDDTLKLRNDIDPISLKGKLNLQTQFEGLSSRQMMRVIEEVITNSVVTDHPFFMNQMFGKTQPISFLADILIAMLNTSMYTYEVAPVFSLIEKEIISNLGARVWGKGHGDGVFTAGGSMSNMNALFLARQNYQENIKQSGLFNTKAFAIFVSEQAHYSFTKGVNFLGFGTESLIKVKSNADASIHIESLKKAIETVCKNNRIPLMVIGIAGTTISGSFDPLDKLAVIAKEHNMWYHVDAAFGGSLLFCTKEKTILNGIENADSVSWNFHKVMGMSLSTSSFLTKEKGVLNKAFNVDAGYLFHENDYDFDLGQKSLRGGRRPDAFKLWLHWKYMGDLGFAQHILKLRTATHTLATLIVKNKKLELYQKPQSSIVLFRYLKNKATEEDSNLLNKKIRTLIFKEGKLIFNYSQIHGTVYLRCVILDPEISKKQLQHIVDTVVRVGDGLI